MRECTGKWGCGQMKPLSEFRVVTVGKQAGYVIPWCKSCDYKRQRRARMLSKFGIDYEVELEKQGGKCAICGSTEDGRSSSTHFAVDHDHATGKYRGLLCTSCNNGLGRFKDNVEVLKAAIAYLEERS